MRSSLSSLSRIASRLGGAQQARRNKQREREREREGGRGEGREVVGNLYHQSRTENRQDEETKLVCWTHGAPFTQGPETANRHSFRSGCDAGRRVKLLRPAPCCNKSGDRSIPRRLAFVCGSIVSPGNASTHSARAHTRAHARASKAKEPSDNSAKPSSQQRHPHIYRERYRDRTTMNETAR